MPSRNTVKQFDAPAYYHVYNRGAGGRQIYLDDRDREKFLSLFARHLDTNDDSVRGDGLPYEKYDASIVAYCLMGNHFHLLVYQPSDPEAATKLMRSVGTAYTMYFNKRHKQQGHLFQGIFKASRITNESYLAHISRYIHMNPRSYMRYQWSSIGAYLGRPHEAWLQPDIATTMNPAQYRDFLKDYESQKTMYEEIKDELAL